MAERPMTVAELRAWRERFAGEPWAHLALATAAAHEPSPIKVMQRLFDLMEMNAPAEQQRVSPGHEEAR